ncbi:MAG: hypothetical protein R3336_03350 [Phycisphaeraceae bacterium]|nr:hypothetical protein [Phycisphaeraceae bacterium]
MNFLTKAFVVLVTILSVMLVAVLVPFVANTENYRIKYEDAVQARNAMEATAQQRQAEISALESAESQRIAKLKSEVEVHQAQISSLEQELATAQAQKQVEASRAAQALAENSRLAAVMSQQGNILEALQEELKDRRREMLDQQRRSIELADRNNQLTSELETFRREVRRMRERMASLEEANSDLEQMLARLPDDMRRRLTRSEDGVGTGPYVPTEVIRGEITEIREMQGERFVQINVGSKDGVAPSMKFWVHRGDEFLGTVVITAVDAQSAAGKIDLAQGDFRISDEVLTGGL